MSQDREQRPVRASVETRELPRAPQLARRVMGSDSIALVSAALRNARKEFRTIKKDKENIYQKSRYADLATVLAAVDDALEANGLILLEATRWDDGELWLDVTLLHESGEWLGSVYGLFTNYMDPQKIGSCLTYARRYVPMAMLGIAPEDDDGNTAAHVGPARHEQRREQSQEQRPPHHDRAPAPNRQDINRQFAPRATRSPERKTWSQFASQRLEDVRSRWMLEMTDEGVDVRLRRENAEVSSEPRMVNYLCTELIKVDKIAPETVTKTGAEGKPVRDEDAARNAVAAIYARNPNAIGRAVDNYFVKKLEKLRADLGMPTTDDEGEVRMARASNGDADVPDPESDSPEGRQ